MTARERLNYEIRYQLNVLKTAKSSIIPMRSPLRYSGNYLIVAIWRGQAYVGRFELRVSPLGKTNCTPAVIGPRHLKHSGFSSRFTIDKCPRMIQLNFSLGEDAVDRSAVPLQTNTSDILFLFRYVPLAPLRLANIKKKRRVESFLAFVTFPIFIEIRTVRRGSYWISKPPTVF